MGPGLINATTVTARHNFAHGFLQALYARADDRDRETGEPTPQAPRLIWDFLATIDKLPFHLVARGENEHVGISLRATTAGKPSKPSRSVAN